MATFVLVHGAWQGASTWDLVVPKLWAAGHRVYTPTLIGLGANAHRLTPQVNLDMHVQDVVGVINYERLQDVILVGHSYAGMIITGAAESVKERLARLVYADAFILATANPPCNCSRNDFRRHSAIRLDPTGTGGGFLVARSDWICGA